MTTVPSRTFGRRSFIAKTSALGVASLLHVPPSSAAEPPPEIKKVRLVRNVALCLAPQYIAEELLHLEGFTDVEYVEVSAGLNLSLVERNQADLTMEAAPALAFGMDANPSVVALAGIHGGCYELIANEKVHAIRDLKGKTVAVYAVGGGDHVLLSSMLAYVGMDPRKDVTWLVEENVDAMHNFVEGKADAFMGFAPQPQELRAKGVGRVIVNTTQDRPWSQYFCCMLVASREFISKYPVATKRSLRAFLKAADICAQDPERAAKLLVAKGYDSRYEMALEVVKSLPYRMWREADPEDSLRFFGLRLHEVGMIKSTPQKLIARGTDWRFLRELKKELKA